MFASTAFGQLRYIQETTYGVTPATGTGANLRTTGPDTKAAVQSVSSNEINANRMVTSATNVDMTVDGGFAFELSAREYDPFIAGVMCGQWRHYGTAGCSAPVSVTTAANKITAATAPTGVDAFTNLKCGQWFRLVPDATATYLVRDYFANAWFKVSDTVAPTTTVITLADATPLAGAGIIATAAPMRITSSVVVNGKDRSSFTLEWEQGDIGQFLQYIGMRPNTMSLDFAVGAILTGSFGFFGKKHDITQASTLPGGPNFKASNNGEVMNSVTNMGVLSISGTNVLSSGTSFIHNAKLEITNNLRGQKALGTFGNAGVGYGDFGVTGSLEVYFENEQLYKSALRGDGITLALGVADSAGNGYLIELPRAKFTNPALNLGNKDSDVMVSLPFQAFFDAGKGYGISITRASVV